MARSFIGIRPGLLAQPRRCLLHLLSTSDIDSSTVFALELIQNMDNYGHTVIYADPPGSMPETLMWALQAYGVNLLQVDSFNAIDRVEEYAAAIAYNVGGELNLPIPTIYYAYNTFSAGVAHDVLIAPSEYMRAQLRSRWNVTPDYVMPPAVRSRMFRGLKRNAETNQPFTVGIFSSGRPNKYPKRCIEQLMEYVPDDVRLIFTHLSEKGAKPKRRRPNIWMVPKMLDAALKGLQLSDVAIYAHSDDHVSTYGRLCMEMLATGVPVICQRKGAPASILEDGKHVLFFDRHSEIIPRIRLLRQDPRLGEMLGANGQLFASWHDITIHVGTIKGVLRTLGA